MYSFEYEALGEFYLDNNKTKTIKLSKINMALAAALSQKINYNEAFAADEENKGVILSLKKIKASHAVLICLTYV